MAKLLGVVELIDDPRFLTNRERLANSSELLALLEKPFLAKTAQQWMDAFLDASIPAGVVNTLDLALSNAQVQHRDMVMSLEDDVGHRIRVVGNPIKFDGADTTPRHYPPRLGQDTEAVLKNVLGKSQAEIVGLMAKSVVFQAASPNAT